MIYSIVRTEFWFGKLIDIPAGDVDLIFKVKFLNSLHITIARALAEELLLGESPRTWLVSSQASSFYRANVDPDLCSHMV